MTELKEKIKVFPSTPGVYKFLGPDGKILYIGKAKNLKKRVVQYFGHDKRVQLPFLIAEAIDIDFTSTPSELDAIYLENTLISKYQPKYNIDLRDDKNFAFIKIDYACEIPEVTYVRKIEKQTHAKYFGPYSAVYKIRRTIEFLRRTFGICGNRKIERRPCFYYHLKRCPGVCAGDITIEQYKEHLKKITDFLSGDRSSLVKRLQKQMKAAAKTKKFELAASLRDQLQQFEILGERQTVILPRRVNWDVFAVYSEGKTASVALTKVRFGKVIDSDAFSIQLKTDSPPPRILQSFIEKYYLTSPEIPGEIFIQFLASESDVLETALREKAGKKVAIKIPVRGKALRLLEAAEENARLHVRREIIQNIKQEATPKEILLSLQQILNLPTLPLRIECYDNSNVQGTNPVGSMVVFQDGLPKKSEYRKFKFNRQTPDDFASMKEMLSRRLKYLHPKFLDFHGRENREKGKFSKRPDLIVIDGGKGQLKAALEAQSETLEPKTLTLSPIPMIGLAKRIEEIFISHSSQPITLPHDNPALQLLQRLRDEAHRFGITFHRDLRSKQAMKSKLDDIRGIGPAYKRILKQKFGSITNIRAASEQELEEIVGKKLTRIIRENL
ncbi:MAG TPA: excinuclease ABC subunit UvrC [Patescibacteria group bacterium]|nr:excinuclease ABC subunit UvrC [Patescibacteria group bacterium]